MSKRLAFAFVLASLLALLTPLHARAPLTQYETFDQSVAVIVDSKTKLKWQRVVGGAVTFAEAAQVCSTLALEGTGWRVPTVKELSTLVDELLTPEYRDGQNKLFAIDLAAFPAAPDAPFWTSSPVAEEPSRAWVVEFDRGTVVTRSTSDRTYVRCVK